jgi:hypothetical protein
MDTLDKKMQTILEREDLSADKRLKLYLNVYDDYRPRPVAEVLGALESGGIYLLRLVPSFK